MRCLSYIDAISRAIRPRWPTSRHVCSPRRPSLSAICLSAGGPKADEPSHSVRGMPLLSDDQAARLQELASSRTSLAGAVAARWIKALLADRAERVALAQRVSRQIENARRDL